MKHSVTDLIIAIVIAGLFVFMLAKATKPNFDRQMREKYGTEYDGDKYF